MVSVVAAPDTSALNACNVAELQHTLAHAAKRDLFPIDVDVDQEPCLFRFSDPVVPYLSYDARRMSSSANSTAETESSITSRGEKRPLTPADSPPPKRHSADPAWDDIDDSSAHDDSSRLGPDDHSKVHLPPIASPLYDDPSRPEYRRASLPTLHSESRVRHSPYPSSAARAAMHNSYALSSYTFPPQQQQNVSESADRGRPRIDITSYSGGGSSSSSNNTSIQNSYNDSPYSNPGLSSSTSTGTPLSGSHFSFGSSPLQPDYPPRSSTYPEHESWGANASHIVRPSSTPGHLSSPPVKYDDSLRHASFSASSPMPHMQMFAGSARISGQQDRLRHYGPPSSTGGRNDWSFPPGDEYNAPGMPSGQYGSSMPSLPPAVSSNISPRPSLAPLDGDHRLPPPAPVAPRKRGKLPKETTDYLKAWLHRHSDHPYPSEEEKKQLCHATGLSMSQVSNWMINARRRILAPVVRAASASTSPSTGLSSQRPPIHGPMEGRRQSMPADNLQLYHPMTLQSMPNTPTHHQHSASDYVGSRLGGPAVRSTYSTGGDYGRGGAMPLAAPGQHTSGHGGYLSTNQFPPMYASSQPQQHHTSANGYITSGGTGSGSYAS